MLLPPVESALADLDGAGNIAVSTDALALTGKTLGDTIDVRSPGKEAAQAKIVAIYERGLAFGDYIIDMPDGADALVDTVYIETASAPTPAVTGAISALGFSVATPAAYAAHVAERAGAEQQLSAVLLFVLLAFLAAAAANTLVMTTNSRREEFLLLRRLGATRTQLMRMVLIETAFMIVAALSIGILAVLPALIGVGQVLLGVPLPTFNLAVTGGLALAVALLTIITVPVVAARMLPSQSLTSRAL